TEKQILDYVQKQPCTINDIAMLLGRNWRTANSYVERAAQETGLIAIKVFRKGSRGALKIVYWSALDSQTGSAHQKALLKRIVAGRTKEDFSAFDIYQFVSEDKREARVKEEEEQASPSSLLEKAGEQFLSFSGNLSWIDLYPDTWQQLEDMAKRHVSIKVLTRIDLTSKEKTEKLLAINERVGWDAVAVRHAEHPLRAMIIDDRLASIKEVLSPNLSQYKELKKKLFIFYRIRDEDWVRWLQQVFWNIWEHSVDAETRLKALATIHVKK
ncbi:hypothetical protein GOV10_03930, partial [Candidatus Woesearchaeota archaeon]|nr:hypothetical protein [Candidatus Woesearchaeota archaeon]